MIEDRRPGFVAHVSREDNLWVIVVDGPLPDGSIGVTDTPRFGEITGETRDLIADLTDLDEDQFDVRCQYIVNGNDMTDELLRYQDAEREFREVSSRLQNVRDRARAQVLESLARQGLSQRAMSDVVDLSQQRVNQILRGGRSAGPQASAG